MAIAKVVDLGSATSKSSASSIPMTAAANAGIGDTVLVAYAGSTTTSAVSSFTDSVGNTYTVLADVAGTSSRLAIGGTVVTVPIVSASTVITANLAAASGIRDIVAVDFSGLTLTQNVAAKSAAGTSTTPSTGASAATSVADTLTFAAIAESNGTTTVTFTPGTGYTADQAATTGITGTNRSLQTEHRINSSTGTQTADATIPSLPWDALEVILEAAAGATLITMGDSVGLTDTVAPSATLSPTDAVATTDVVAPTAVLSVIDQATVSEAAVAVRPDQITITDTIVVTVIPDPIPPGPVGTGGGGDAWATGGRRVLLRPPPKPAPVEPDQLLERIVTQRGVTMPPDIPLTVPVEWTEEEELLLLGIL